MHHNHVYEEFLLMYILFARRTHGHEGIFFNILCSDAYGQDTCNTLPTLSWLCSHMFYIPYSHDCIHVGGAYACYMSFQSFTCYFLNLYLKLWCMLSSITKKGEIESTSAPWVVLVINVNISLVGLTLLSSMFQISSTMEWHGLKDVGTPSRC